VLVVRVKVTTFVAAAPTVVDAKNGAVVRATGSFTVKVSALDGATESIPNPNDATATSAMRLKVVFVDICFLSISRDRESPALGFGPKLPSHMS
jgi:hypothetical protein